MTPGQRHRSYLLRIWRAGNHDAPEWRFFLEDVHTHEHQAFADLDSLMAFLAAQLGAGASGNAPAQRAADARSEPDAG
jgi:hypothetical protein